MKLTTLVILVIGCVIAWPIAKDAAIDKMVNKFVRETELKKTLNQSDIGGPLGSTIAFTLMKGIAGQMIAQQDIGTQIELVFEVLVLNDMPTVPSM